MLVIKLDYEKGGIAILECKKSKLIRDKYLAIYQWDIVYRYGNISSITFKLNELQSSDNCFFVRKEDTFTDIQSLVPILKLETENMIKYAEEDKKDNEFLLKEVEKDFKEEIQVCKTNISESIKRIRDWKNYSAETDLENRGLLIDV